MLYKEEIFFLPLEDNIFLNNIQARRTLNKPIRIEFLYFDGCPHHEETYKLLQSVLEARGVDASIERIEIKDDEDAARYRFVGSPTIRINGIDIDPVRKNQPFAKTCRIYVERGTLKGTPSRSMIESLLMAEK